MKYLFTILMISSAQAADFSTVTKRTFDDKPKANLVSLGENVTDRVRAELDMSIAIKPTHTDMQSTAGVSVNYTLIRDRKWKLNSKVGMHYQTDILNSHNAKYYGSLGFELVKRLGDNKFYVVEVSKKIDQTNLDGFRMISGFQIITGMRYEF